MGKQDLHIGYCSRKAAEYAVKRWHYSRCMPSCDLITFGVWEYGEFIGSVIFGRGASPHLLTRYRIAKYQGCELVRVALSAHRNSVTRILSICFTLLRKKYQNLKLIVSFADPSEGHAGGIYKGGNWVYCGKSNKTIVYRDNKGKDWHVRTVHGKGRKFEEIVEKEGKHRFVYILDKTDKDLVQLVEGMRKPYEKKDACKA